MTLPLHVHSGYPSYGSSGTAWAQAEYDAYKFAKALKGEDFGGYADLRCINGSWKRITSANRAPAFEIFGRWAAQVITDAEITGAYLIPVPGSQCVRFDTDEKGRRLCEAVALYLDGFIADEAFHWDEPMVPAHKGGLRRKEHLIPHLSFWENMPSDRPVVLIDDVATLHGHMKACAHVLRQFGHSVPIAIAAAQTIHDRPVHSMFQFPVIDLDAPEPGFLDPWGL